MNGSALLVRGGVDADAGAITALGLGVTSDAYLRVQTCTDDDARHRAHDLAASLIRPGAWLIAASANGVRAMGELLGWESMREHVAAGQAAGAQFAAVGPTSAAALHDAGAHEVRHPARQHTASALLALLAAVHPAVAVLPRSDVADGILPQTLRSRGWAVCDRVLYRTSTVETRPASADALADGRFDVLVLRSPSAVRAILHHVSHVPARTHIVAGGPTTALAAAREGLQVSAVAQTAQADGIAKAVATAMRHVRSGAGHG